MDFWANGICDNTVSVPLEERQLEKRFGKEYKAYNQTTKMIIPWVL